MANTLPHWIHHWVAGMILLASAGSHACASDEAHQWTRSTEFEEMAFTETIDSKIRIHVNAPFDQKDDAARATRLIVYTLPAGNTIEQTLGCQTKTGLDWHYDIQHVAAQIRLLRSLTQGERIVLVCVEGPKLSWSSFRKAHLDADAKMADLVEKWRKEFGTDDARVMLTGHSNGGSFMFGVIDGSRAIPSYIDRIAFLDSNYNFDATKHTDKLARWLKGNGARRLIVIAYDDREITYEGKKVNSPTGGTFRATGRMHEALGKAFELSDKINPPFQETIGLDGRIHFYVHPNPKNIILHTALVGDMNGLVQAATLGTPNEGTWGKFGGPRAYMKWVQAEPTPAPIQPKQTRAPIKATSTTQSAQSEPQNSGLVIRIGGPLVTTRQTKLPPRPKNAVGGTQFMKSLEGLQPVDREAAILHEIMKGNFPEFLRNFKTVPIVGKFAGGTKDVSATMEVMPDYLAVGSDSDFVRIPMFPQTAQVIADRFGCTLPTRKMVDAIDQVAEAHVEPHPMTKEREAMATFLEHNQIVENQRRNQELGLLLIGTKKDIVLTPKIYERPKRLAIYGWRQLNGKPIQPLTTLHVNTYVDYSHGVRLVRDRAELDGKAVKISELLADPNRCGLVSDEGPMNPPRYPPK
jgi:hypothetical protein